MPVPEEVRKVPRPVNTVVVENKAEGLRKYAVRARKGLKRIPGKHSRPVNGPVIGYIFNGEYIPLEKVPEIEPPRTSCRTLSRCSPLRTPGACM